MAEVWPLRRTLPDGLPDRSLGWQVVTWMECWLRSPADGVSPLRLTGEQGRFALWWYALDAAGRWLFRRGQLRRPKGWGKDPFSAMLAWAELLGPVRFSAWSDVPGVAVGVPARSPVVQVCAVSEAQTRTTTSMLSVLASPELLEAYRVDVGERRVKASVGGMAAELRPLTASARSAEGARATFVIANESQHWLASNGGHAMSAVLRRNLAKSPDGAARELSITNAYSPGEESVAEVDGEAWEVQRQAGGGDLLLDTVEPVGVNSFGELTDRELVSLLRSVYGDSVWIDVERLLGEVRDPKMSDAEARRFYGNLVAAGEAMWVSGSALDACRDWGELPDDGEHVAVGFDGSRRRDATALVCVGMESGRLWAAGVWERDWDDADWEVPQDEVVAAVEEVHGRWRVERMYCDPHLWEEQVARWCQRWESVAFWWMSGNHRLRAARAVTGFRAALLRGEVSWGEPGAEVFRRHVLSAVERKFSQQPGADLHTIGKRSRSAGEHIDAAIAAVVAWQARNDALRAGWEPPATFRAVRPAASEV